MVFKLILLVMHECLFQTILLSTYCASCFKGRWFSRLVAIGHYVVISIFRGTRLLSMVWMAANSCVMLMSNRMLKYQWMHKITLQRWAKIILCVSFCVFSMVWCAFTGISVTICNLGGTVTVSLCIWLPLVKWPLSIEFSFSGMGNTK